MSVTLLLAEKRHANLTYWFSSRNLHRASLNTSDSELHKTMILQLIKPGKMRKWVSSIVKCSLCLHSNQLPIQWWKVSLSSTYCLDSLTPPRQFGPRTKLNRCFHSLFKLELLKHTPLKSVDQTWKENLNCLSLQKGPQKVWGFNENLTFGATSV